MYTKEFLLISCFTWENVRKLHVFVFELLYFSALEALVNFAYNGSVEIDSNNVQSLLVGASFLHLQSVKEACCDFLKKRYLYLA